MNPEISHALFVTAGTVGLCAIAGFIVKFLIDAVIKREKARVDLSAAMADLETARQDLYQAMNDLDRKAND